MYAVIIKNGSEYELQLKQQIDSSNVSHSGKSSNVELLKQSLTAEWERFEQGDIVWVAKLTS